MCIRRKNERFTTTCEVDYTDVTQVIRSSADADKHTRRVWRSVKVTKHSTVPYVRYSFLMCNSNFVFKTRRFYDIRLQKCPDLEMGSKVTQGH